MKFKKYVYFSLFFLPLSLLAQLPDSTLEKVAPKVFIDCQWCDIDYIRTEINFVNYVYDRKNADIHILITSQTTGSGGIEYTLTYIGQNNFAAQHDTLVFTTKQDDTSDMIRSKMVKYLKVGLIPYLSKTPIIDDISVGYVKPSGAMVKEDKWNNWVFRMRLSGWFRGEKSSRNSDIYGRISADRITEEWKIRFSLNSSYDENKYKWDNEWIKSNQESKSFSGTIVRSLSDRWSAGGYFSARSSTYMNTKAAFSIAPAIEFNLFPYSESTRRELRFLYRIGGKHILYDEETIYFKTEENLLSQGLEISLEFKQPWGTVETTISGSHYFHDFDKNYLSIFSNLSIRLFKGFSVNLFGGFSMIHNQLHLRRQSPNKEDVLLRRYALETNYDYWCSVGFEYAFGSIFNNIVNPRFGGSGGSRIIIM